MKRKKQFAALAVLLLAAVLIGCGAKKEPEHTVTVTVSEKEERPAAPYRFGVGYSGSGYTAAFTEWSERVLEATDGNVEIVLFGDNKLGDGQTMLKAVRAGTLSVMASSTSVQTDIVPEAAVMDIPACFEGYSVPFVYYEGDFFREMNTRYNMHGLELLYIATGEPWIISSAHPIGSLDALKGFRLRTSGSSFHNRLYDALGIRCVDNVELSGLAYIIGENRVDGIETTARILRSQELTAVQPYALELPVFVMSSAIVMNRDAYLSLPAEYRDVLKSTLGDILVKRFNSVDDAESGPVTETLSGEDIRQLRVLAEPLYDEIVKVTDRTLREALKKENLLHNAY